MLIVRATRKLIQRLGGAPRAGEADESTTLLGDWYATLLPWRPRQLALLINERTLVPVLLPLATSATMLDRFPDALGSVLDAHGVPPLIIRSEVEGAREHRVAPTADRSLVGSLTEAARMADAHRWGGGDLDLLRMSRKLSDVPCGPLYARHVTPANELAVLVRTSRGEHLGT